jgi:shikimate dehydrogenase
MNRSDIPNQHPEVDVAGSITGETRTFGIFGDPIVHTLSPLMQNAAFKALGLSCRYLPFQVHPENLKKAVEAIIPLGIRGVNVTIPHKVAVIPHLDSVAAEALKIGAVNTIETASGRLIGHNTDGAGFLASLSELNIDPSGKRVILIGAGGASRGVAVALLSAGVSEMILMARTAERGRHLARHLNALSSQLKVSVQGMDLMKEPSLKENGSTLLINSTPLGMKMHDPLPFPASLIDPRWVVADLIYRPYETPLLSAAKKIGAKTVPGLGMLLHQGALAFEIWTKEPPPLKVMKEVLQRAVTADERH